MFEGKFTQYSREGVSGFPIRPDLDMRLASWRREPILRWSRQKLKPLGYLVFSVPLELIHSVVVSSLKEANVSLRQGSQAKEFMSWTEQGFEFLEVDHGCQFDSGDLSESNRLDLR